MSATSQDQQGVEVMQEFVASRGVELRVDRETSVIHGVKILGLVSRNGREYSKEAVQKAAGMYEGKVVNVDHTGPDSSRSYRDVIGRLSAVQVRPDGLYGDLKVNPKHAVSEQLLWDAENAPENVGLSHDVRGKVGRRGGKTVVENIEAVRSVDLVAEPATTSSLFESVDTQQEREPEMDLKEVTLDALRTSRPDLVESLTATVTKQITESAEAKAVQEELKTLRTKVEGFEAKEAIEKRRGEVIAELKEAKLDPADELAVSPIFLEMLVAEGEKERRAKLIEDRKKMREDIAQKSPGSSSRLPESMAPATGGRQRREMQDVVAGWRGQRR